MNGNRYGVPVFTIETREETWMYRVQSETTAWITHYCDGQRKSSGEYFRKRETEENSIYSTIRLSVHKNRKYKKRRIADLKNFGYEQ